jgi:hypothetical protein
MWEVVLVVVFGKDTVKLNGKHVGRGGLKGRVYLG